MNKRNIMSSVTVQRNGNHFTVSAPASKMIGYTRQWHYSYRWQARQKQQQIRESLLAQQA